MRALRLRGRDTTTERRARLALCSAGITGTVTVPQPFQQAVAEGSDALTPALALLDHPDPAVVTAALYALLGLPDDRQLEPLTRILVDPRRTELNRSLVTSALLSVVGRTDPEAALRTVTTVRRDARDHLRREPDLEARLVAGIRPQWGTAAIDRLLEGATSPEIGVRAEALRNLADGFGDIAESVAFGVLDRGSVDDRRYHGPAGERGPIDVPRATRQDVVWPATAASVIRIPSSTLGTIVSATIRAGAEVSAPVRWNAASNPATRTSSSTTSSASGPTN